MSCYVVGINIICRVLNGTEVIDIVCPRYNNHSAGVLTCCTLDARTADCKALFLCLMHCKSTFLCVLFDKSYCCFFCNGCDCTSLEHVILSEQFFSVAVRFGLILTAEVKVNIRNLVTLEAQEGFKRNFVTVLIHSCTAFRAILWRQIKSRTVTAVGDKFTVLTIWADIVRTKRINLGNT